MHIHVVRACNMPSGVLVWADPQSEQTVVYADPCLFHGGELTAEGHSHIQSVLQADDGEPPRSE